MKHRRGSSCAVLLALCGLFIGCGGSSAASGVPTESGLGGNKQPPPPPTIDGPAKPTERNISNDARKDYTAAVEFFKQQQTAGWTKDRCQDAASKFAGVASQHKQLVEARYMSGLSYHQCGMSKEAEEQYQLALQINKAHAPSLSNLGELYFKAGKAKSAQQYWESALKADKKLVAAYVNQAWLALEDLRKMKPYSEEWKKRETEARDLLSKALAVNNDKVEAYVLYGLVYLEGYERNGSRLDLARLLLEEGEKRNNKYAPLYNARGLMQMKRDNQGLALEDFNKAVELDPEFLEARMNVGNITLGFRNYEIAEAQFTKALQLDSKNYDAMIGLGIARRGLGKLEDAEKAYKQAIDLDKSKGAAYFNLGVLYKDFRANQATDLQQSKKAYETARDHFNSYMSKGDATEEGKAEAKDNIDDCGKIIKQLDEAIKATANQPAAQ